MLDGKEGYAVQKSMQILVALGEIFGAKSLIDVGSVQVAGVSYANLGDAGLDATVPLVSTGKGFSKQEYVKVDLNNYV